MFGLQPQTIRQMRLEPGTDGYRTPPAGWLEKLAVIAESRGKYLASYAKTLWRLAAEGGQ
jgi:hypothetical protein